MSERKEILSAYRTMNRLAQMLLERHGGFLPGEYIVLAIQEEGKPMCSTDLAADLNIGKSMLSRYFATLEKEGLVSRAFGKKDKREVVFTITAQGKKKLAAIERDLRQTNRKETH